MGGVHPVRNILVMLVMRPLQMRKKTGLANTDTAPEKKTGGPSMFGKVDCKRRVDWKVEVSTPNRSYLLSEKSSVFSICSWFLFGCFSLLECLRMGEVLVHSGRAMEANVGTDEMDWSWSSGVVRSEKFLLSLLFFENAVMKVLFCWRWQADGQSAEETRVMGAFGYLAPEYTGTGLITEKADVYAFGVVLLELLSGLKASEFSRITGQQFVQEWASPLLEMKLINEIIDPRLKRNYEETEVKYSWLIIFSIYGWPLDMAWTVINLALLLLTFCYLMETENEVKLKD